ncbi:DNA cytosine methyltransferase [Methylolobus aquaticus]
MDNFRPTYEVARVKPTCIDLFSGCGGLSLGLAAAGFSTAFCVEVHSHAFATYRYNLLERFAERHKWPTWLEQRPWCAKELLQQHREELAALSGRIDLIAGGPPCQGFSTNGLRRSDDPRSQMVDVYLKYVETIRPRLVLFENVVGFCSMKHRTGGTYSEYVTTVLCDMGYDTWSSILKAVDWGVPQRRPRFVLIAAPKGALRGIDPIQRMRVGRKKFLEARGLCSRFTTAKSALSDLEERDGQTIPDPEWGHAGFRTLERAAEAGSAYQQLMREGCPDQPKDMRLPRHGLASIQRMQAILENCERGKNLTIEHRKRFGIKKRATAPLDPDAPALTISTLPDDFIHYSRPRSMTVREQARLQSFPDWFSFQGPYTAGGRGRQGACPRFTQVANAVPPLLAEALGEMLIELLPLLAPDQIADVSERADVIGKDSSNLRKIRDTDFVAAL